MSATNSVLVEGCVQQFVSFFCCLGRILTTGDLLEEVLHNALSFYVSPLGSRRRELGVQSGIDSCLGVLIVTQGISVVGVTRDHASFGQLCLVFLGVNQAQEILCQILIRRLGANTDIGTTSKDRCWFTGGITWQREDGSLALVALLIPVILVIGGAFF